MAARLLAARMFNAELVDGVLDEMDQTRLMTVGFEEKLAEIKNIQLPALQRFVRSQFLSIKKEKWSRTLRDFIESVVKPALVPAAQACDPRLASQAARLAVHLHKGTLHTVEQVELKLAVSVAAGDLRGHPLVQGILCAAIEQAQRAKRGVLSMRNHKLSETELGLMTQAGAMIAAAAGSRHLLKQMGLAFTQSALPLDNLIAHSIPDAFCACKEPEILRENVNLINSALLPVTRPMINKADENEGMNGECGAQTNVSAGSHGKDLQQSPDPQVTCSLFPGWLRL